jgi:hypothetical protein
MLPPDFAVDPERGKPQELGVFTLYETLDAIVNGNVMSFTLWLQKSYQLKLRTPVIRLFALRKTLCDLSALRQRAQAKLPNVRRG